jgi:hypothetical protein
MKAHDFETGETFTQTFPADCAKTSDPRDCARAGVDITPLSEGALFKRFDGRARWWFPSDGDVVLGLPRPISAAATGPHGAVTIISADGDAIASYTPTYETHPAGLAEERTLQTGPCDLMHIKPADGLSAMLQCQFSALAVAPADTQQDLAVAVKSGDVFVLRTIADGSDIPDERQLKIDCLPIKSLFPSLTPTRCAVRALRFSTDGAALATLDDGDVIRVFRVDDGPARSADGALLSVIPTKGGVQYFGFGSDSATVVVVLDSGIVRLFHARPAPGETGRSLSRHGGTLRASLCAALGGHHSPLTSLADEDFKSVQSEFPDLGLKPADRAPCAPSQDVLAMLL